MKTCFLYGAIGGDMIGSRFEWNNFKSKDFQLFTEESRFTDDTVMTIATADAILNRKEYAAAYQCWGNEYPNAGYGGSFRKWLKSKSRQPYNSYGNGSAMRVSPVGYIARDVEEVLSEAKASAEVTHDHPEGIKGAQAAALAVYMAKNNASKDEIMQEMQDRFSYELSNWTIDDIRQEYEFDVSCQGTLPMAIRAFIESEDYEDAVRTAISIGGDSDTIAAITGGIALAYYKEMPYHIICEIERRLPRDLRAVCDEFFVRYM